MMKNPKKSSEKIFMDYFLIEASKIPGVTVWRQNTGSRIFRDPATGEKRRFRAGPPKGAADVAGIAEPSGRCLQIEMKAPRKKQTKQQKQWEAMIRRRGGIYLLATQDKNLDAEQSAVQWAGVLAKLLQNYEPTSGQSQPSPRSMKKPRRKAESHAMGP